MPVLIYRDYIHDNGLLHRALCDHYGADKIRYCDADDILDGALDQTIKLFVMPGGADLYYCEKLNGAGNAAIRQWVKQGGTYLGICAGAYYACASIGWACGTKQEISGKRELAFFPGHATGPVYEFIEDQDAGKSCLSAPTLHWDDGQTTHTSNVCYEAGPVFHSPSLLSPPSVAQSGDNNIKILAHYTDLPDAPAIVECAVGKGRAILCSPHIESTPDLLGKSLYRNNNPSYKWDLGVLKKLEKSAKDAAYMRKLLFNRAMNRD
jgi:glutamine amidotransferase-like uncharacterized protein